MQYLPVSKHIDTCMTHLFVINDIYARFMQSGKMTLSSTDLMPCIKEAWEQAFSLSANMRSWNLSGLNPFDMKPYWILKEKEERVAALKKTHQLPVQDSELRTDRLMPIKQEDKMNTRHCFENSVVACVAKKKEGPAGRMRLAVARHAVAGSLTLDAILNLIIEKEDQQQEAVKAKEKRKNERENKIFYAFLIIVCIRL